MTREDDNHKLKKVDLEATEEGHHTNITKSTTNTPSSSRQWSMFKNPRIVRVSRAFGGKDRHSKVTTVRGLRDRRIRLSVPTAIQLYDLQDRLGLAQPSKVVDWLLNATKDEIDKLPPLQMPLGSFNNAHFHQPTLNLESNALKSSFSPFYNTNLSFFKDGATQSSMQGKDEIRENSSFPDEEMMAKSKAWESEPLEQNHQDESNYHHQVSAQNFFPISSHSSYPNLVNINSIPYGSFYPMEPNSNLSLSHFGNHGFQTHIEGGNTSNLQSLQPPNSLGLSSGSHLYLYPPAQTSIFPQHPQYIGAPSENDKVNMFLSNPFMSSLHFHSHDNDKELDKGSDAS